MPKIGKQTKAEQLGGMIEGLRKHVDEREQLVLHGREYTVPSLVAMFTKHLEIMAKVRRLTIERETAIAEERASWEEIQPAMRGVRSLAKWRLGPQNPRVREFGVPPERTPYVSVETKKRANEKRQKTRAERGIVGKRRRAKTTK